jgi:ribonuclease HII
MSPKAGARKKAVSLPRGYPFRLGLDENGLGPRLGPMLVTGALARVSPEGEALLARAPRGGLAERLGDSKAMVAHGSVALAEAWARALVARCHGADAARSPAALVEALSLDPARELEAPCPPPSKPMCWTLERERFVAEPALVATVSRDLDALAKKGVELVGVQSVWTCAKRLRLAAARGEHRFLVDLHAMERLALEARGRAGAELGVVAGKVGMLTRYGPAFGPLAGRLHVALTEGKVASVYRFVGLGELAFVTDAEDRCLTVAMASLVGKYLRELGMARVVAFFQAAGVETSGASGYHDPRTAAFVEATAPTRRRLGIVDECFER